MFSSLYHTQQVAAVSSLSSFAVQTPASLRCLPAYSLFTRAHAPGQEGVQEVLQRDAPPEDRARQGWDPEGLFDRGLERPGSFIAARQASKRKDRLAVAPSIAAEDQVFQPQYYLWTTAVTHLGSSGQSWPACTAQQIQCLNSSPLCH